MPRTIQYQGIVSYGNVTAPFSRLTVEQQILYAEDKTSQIGIAYTFQITGFVTGSNRADFQQKLSQLRYTWTQPRLDFFVQSGTGSNSRLYGFTQGTPVLDYNSSAYLAPVEDWGPLPQNLQFFRFTAGLACQYSVTITCTAKECLPTATQCADILSVTQDWTHTVDLNGLTTRTVSGILRVKSSAANADGYRQYVIPALPTYYQRMNAQYTQSGDGRELFFSVTDAEVAHTLPVPITEGQASLQVHIEPSGLVSYTLNGTFGAPASVSKATILQVIQDLIVGKIPGITTSPGSKGYAWVEAMDFTDHLYANRIDFSVRARLPQDGSVNLLETASAAIAGFAVAPPNSNGVNAIPGVYGGYGTITSGIIAPAHVTYDACSVGEEGEQGTLSGTASTEQNTRSVTPASVATSTYEGISDCHQIAPYLHFHEQISYEFDNGLVTFQPKRHGVDPITQQARTPRLRIIQSGYMTRAAARSLPGQRPTPSSPVMNSSAVDLLQSYVSPASEEVVDSIWSKWTVHWRYIFAYKKAISDSNHLPVGGLYWPPNPVRVCPGTATASDYTFSTPTNLVETLSTST
jgi:hypothetical protein